jgi:hypothetical protein
LANEIKRLAMENIVENHPKYAEAYLGQEIPCEGNVMKQIRHFVREAE